MAGQRYELWFGGEATRQAWSLYSGTVWAPLGDIRHDGWRVRAGAGQGQYSYGPVGAPIYGLSAFSDLLVGYRATFGATTVKAYAGVAADFHHTDPYDAANALDGLSVGPKAVVETWTNLTPSLWGALDLSWTTAHALYSARGRFGWRALPFMSLGVEATGFGSVDSNGVRGGGFVRFEWPDGEISATGGLTGNQNADATPFATLNLTMRF